MTITIDLAPDQEAQLRLKAARQGQDIAGYLIDIARRESQPQAVAHGKHSLLEFEGAGANYATGQDAQEYVNGLRAEWDHRS